MKAVITHKLRQIAADYGIEILYSCESGSRAWGFPSPDSDYDVRFIYLRRAEEYLTIRPGKDHLSFPINDEFDIYGWDLTKVLRLMTKSNTTPFEWLQSPVIYREERALREELWTLSQHYFCARSHIHHYLGVAHGAMQTMQGQEIKIKKLFYVLRPLLAALWCARRQQIAPMSIFPLLHELPHDLHAKVLSLIDRKSTAAEGHPIKMDEDLRRWIDATFDYCQQTAGKMERQSFDIEEADLFFRKTIGK